MKNLRLALLALGLTAPAAASAQSSPNFSYGQVPTAGQWNAAFASKQDVLRFIPLNQSGGTMTGRLQTAPSTTNGSGLAVLPGVAPTTPIDGDVWTTSAGFFARAGGQILSLINPANVSITGGAINGTTIGATTPSAGAFTTLAANGLTLSTPLPIAQGGCGATTALGCLTNLGLAGGTLGYVLTSNGPGTAPTFQAASGGGSTNAVLYTAQSLTSGQQDQVRANISGPVSSAPSSSATLATTDIDRPLFPTGSPTITAANGGAGWRSGPILNSNTLSGFVTLAVPSGATLNGATNGTTKLRPYQKARIVQTGTSAYITDWIDPTPLVVTTTLPANAATANFLLPTGYAWEFSLDNARVSASGATLWMRLAYDGAGTTFSAGSTDYTLVSVYASNGISNGSSAQNYFSQASFIELASNLNNGAFQASTGGRIGPGGASVQPICRYETANVDTANTIRRSYTALAPAGVPTGVQFGVSSGTIQAGTVVTIRGIPQ